MIDPRPRRDAGRLLVVMPSWLGDCVMATPTLRALRGLYPEHQITALVRSSVRPLLDGLPWIDRVVTIRPRRKGRRDGRRAGPWPLARRLASRHFDLAVLLPNGFRSALLVSLAGIPRRIGYDRDGRGFLLTDRLLPRRQSGGFVPVPTHDYYLGIARYLGALDPDPKMRLFTRPSEEEQADRVLRRAGVAMGGDRPFVLLTPGANYGDAKLWPAERYAELADRCVEGLGATVAVTGSPRERAILDRVLGSANRPVADLSAAGLTLGALKAVVRRADVLVTNDTGPRHIAAAFGRPVVTIFGATDPRWTQIDYEGERQMIEPVDCGPCQKKRCPLAQTPQELQCLRRIDVGRVYDAVGSLLGQRASIGLATIGAADAHRAGD